MTRSLARIFAKIPDRYERVNSVLTLGMDARWRRKAARAAAEAGGTRWLDMCSGTGDMACLLDRLSGGDVTIVAADFSLPMLLRAARKPEAERIRFTLCAAPALPFHDASFDLVTVSFATRNLDSSRGGLLESLRELGRVLRPGGRLVNVETSRPPSPLIRRLFDLYVGTVVAPLGRAMTGSDDGYSYLSRSIRAFHDAGELASILEEAGFSPVTYRRLFLGAAAVHTAIKQPPDE